MMASVSGPVDAGGLSELFRNQGGKRKPPNFFLCVQIRDAGLKAKIEETKDMFVRRFPQYTDYREPSEVMHLTLAIAGLLNQAELDACVGAVTESEQIVKQWLLEMEPMEFSGVRNFDQCRVIFSPLRNPEKMLIFCEKVTSLLRQKTGIKFTANRKLHLTMFKVPREEFESPTWPRESGIILKRFSRHFGSQAADNIHLCPMHIAMENSFYPCCATVDAI